MTSKILVVKIFFRHSEQKIRSQAKQTIIKMYHNAGKGICYAWLIIFHANHAWMCMVAHYLPWWTTRVWFKFGRRDNVALQHMRCRVTAILTPLQNSVDAVQT